jgi:hypothetical protein
MAAAESLSKAEIVFDATVYFCALFSRRSRLTRWSQGRAPANRTSSKGARPKALEGIRTQTDERRPREPEDCSLTTDFLRDRGLTEWGLNDPYAKRLTSSAHT